VEVVGNVGKRYPQHRKNYGTSAFFMGKFTISMAIFNSYVSLDGINPHKLVNHGKSTISMAMASIANCESLPEGNRGTGGETIRTQLVGKNYVKTLRYRGFSGNDDLAGE